MFCWCSRDTEWTTRTARSSLIRDQPWSSCRSADEKAVNSWPLRRVGLPGICDSFRVVKLCRHSLVIFSHEAWIFHNSARFISDCETDAFLRLCSCSAEWKQEHYLKWIFLSLCSLSYLDLRTLRDVSSKFPSALLRFFFPPLLFCLLNYSLSWFVLPSH